MDLHTKKKKRKKKKNKGQKWFLQKKKYLSIKKEKDK